MTFLQPDQTRRPSESLGPFHQDRTPAPASHDAPSDEHSSKRRLWLIVLAGVIGILLVAGIAGVAVWRSLPTPHLTIEVFNDTGAPMREVRFVVAGGHGVRSCDTIASGNTRAWDVTGRSDGFTLEYRQPDGRLVTRECVFALDGDDWGNITLHVKRGGLKILTEVEEPGNGHSQ